MAETFENGNFAVDHLYVMDDLYEKVTGRHLNLSSSIASFNKFEGIALFDV